jgi:hypothetical protein
MKEAAQMKKQIIGMAALGLMIAAPALADENVMSKFKMSIGGFVKLDYVYNSTALTVPSSSTNAYSSTPGNSYSALLPSSGAIPKTTSIQGKTDESTFTARQSRLWIKSTGPELFGGKTMALIEGDFYGADGVPADSPGFRLRHAYATVDWTKTQILVGQYWDIFGPMTANTVDFRQGASFGSPNEPRLPQIRVTQKYGNDDNFLKLVVGAQNPAQDNYQFGTAAAPTTYTSGAYVNGAAQALFVSNALGKSAGGYMGMSMQPLTVGLFGLGGYNTYHATGTLVDAGESLPSWGYGLYAYVPLLKSSDGKSRAGTAAFEGQIYEGANMAFNSATASGVVKTPNGKLNAAKGYGVAAQLLVNPTQDLGMTVGYERREVINSGNYTAADTQQSNYQFFFNTYYNFNAAVMVAAEYQYARTNYINNTVTTSDFGFANVGRLSCYYFF